MGSISFQYPAWFLAFCLLLGLAYAVLMYRKTKDFQDAPKYMTALMGFLRFLTVSIIAILLLAPVLKWFSNDIEKPILTLALDQSQSMRVSMTKQDSTDIFNGINNIYKRFEDQYDIHTVGFGSEIDDSIHNKFDDKNTDISEALEYVDKSYGDQNLGAMVLISDGIYNEGTNPVYAAQKFKSPVYTIAVGDTIPKKDQYIKSVYYNELVYLGDKFPLEVDLSAYNLTGNTSTLKITELGEGAKELANTTFSINNTDEFATKKFLLNADKPGLRKIRIQLSGISGEYTLQNNVQDIYINVLDGRQKILILEKSPHPDIAALKYILENNKNYQVTDVISSSFNGNIHDYDLVIFHQLPSADDDSKTVNLIQQVKTSSIPSLFIIGNLTDLNQLNQTQDILKILPTGQQQNTAQAIFEPNFNLFEIPEEMRQRIVSLEPVYAPFGSYQPGGSSQILLYQKIGSVDTKYPLLMFGNEGNKRIGIFAAEGIWKLKLNEYQRYKSFDAVNMLFGKTVQYLAVKQDKRKFRVRPDKVVFSENEPVSFMGELYNDSYELVNDPDVSLAIRNKEGKEYRFTFSKNEKSYKLSGGIFEPGDYTFTGKVSYAGKELTSEGKFSVQNIQKELFNTTADFNLLNSISSETGGQLFYASQFDQLIKKIESHDLMKPVIHQQVKTDPAIHLKWIFWLLFGLLTLEWFLRRYHGSY